MKKKTDKSTDTQYALAEQTATRIKEALQDDRLKEVLYHLTEIETPNTQSGESPLNVVFRQEQSDFFPVSERQANEMANHLLGSDDVVNRSAKLNALQWLVKNDVSLDRINEYVTRERSHDKLKRVAGTFLQKRSVDKEGVGTMLRAMLDADITLGASGAESIVSYVVRHFSLQELQDMVEDYELDFSSWERLLYIAMGEEQHGFARAVIDEAGEKLSEGRMPIRVFRGIGNLDFGDADEDLVETWKFLFQSLNEQERADNIQLAAEKKGHTLKYIAPVMNHEERILATACVMAHYKHRAGTPLGVIDDIASDEEKRSALLAAMSEATLSSDQLHSIMSYIESEPEWEAQFIDKLFDCTSEANINAMGVSEQRQIINTLSLLNSSGFINLEANREAILEKAQQEEFDKVEQFIEQGIA